MMLTMTRNDGYAAGFEALQAGVPGPAWLKDLRQRAWQSFSDLDFPTARRGNERWKYTNVRPIASAQLSAALDLDPEQGADEEVLRAVAPWNNSWVNLVFVDGGLFVHAVLSGCLGRVRQQLPGRWLRETGLCTNHLGQYAAASDDAFVALNTAFLRDGALVQVPPGQDCPSMLNLVYLTTGRSQPKAVFPRTLVVAAANSRVAVSESYVSLAGEGNLTNAVTEIVVEEGAQVDHYRLLRENSGGYHVGTTRVSQAGDSSFSSTSCAFGMALGRHDLQVTLDGPGSACDLRGLYLTAGTQHMDNFINIDHASPHTTSDLFYKGVLDGRSKAIFGGTVLVRKDSQKTRARQTDRNLLLSKYAEIDSKPSLLIYADDVQCGHGATAGHIDPEALFYLRSRGLGLEAAHQFLVQAFIREVMDAVKVEPLQEFLEQAFTAALPGAAANQERAL